MSENKKINVSPDLFKVPDNTRKSRPKTEPKIKIKTGIGMTPGKSKTLRRNVLKLIRAKQQDEYKRMFSGPPKGGNAAAENPVGKTETEFSKEFDSSLQYFTNLAEKIETEKINTYTPTPNSSTLKNYNTYQPSSTSFFPESENVSLEMPREPPIHMIAPRHPNPNPVSLSHPGYGCLKNGAFPTYRTWKNHSAISHPAIATQAIATQSIATQSIAKTPSSSYSAPAFVSQPRSITDNSYKSNHFIAHKKLQMEMPLPTKIKRLKRRKIYRRTFRLGKSQVAPKISCLISNKTIRQKVQQATHELKHADMRDVRKFLLKKGFIKVGTIAPNDVLRKMYESVNLVCGQVENHNPDNLLFNFVNDKSDM